MHTHDYPMQERAPAIDLGRGVPPPQGFIAFGNIAVCVLGSISDTPSFCHSLCPCRKLVGVDFSHCTLAGCDFGHADLRRARLDGADLTVRALSMRTSTSTSTSANTSASTCTGMSTRTSTSFNSTAGSTRSTRSTATTATEQPHVAAAICSCYTALTERLLRSGTSTLEHSRRVRRERRWPRRLLRSSVLPPQSRATPVWARDHSSLHLELAVYALCLPVCCACQGSNLSHAHLHGASFYRANLTACTCEFERAA